jgi:hypothetical protein
MRSVDPSESAEHLERLELYRLAVEMADRMSARRGSANAFYLTAETTLVTVQGVAFASIGDAPWLVVVAMVLAGIGLSLAWWLQLRSYRLLSRAKFGVILDLEKDLVAAIYRDEWGRLTAAGPGRSGRYTDLGVVERLVPGMFALLYLALAVGALAL